MNISIRELASVDELKRSEALQRDVWGEDDPPDNADLLLAIQHEGGLVAGAFQDEHMIGFLFAFPSHTPSVQHSHRLAVHPVCRGMGLGVRLKWYQRSWCLERDISMVRWTYDPLLSVNASLNISRLGATASIYHENYYGEMPGINAGVPSDRLIAEWHLNDPRVRRRSEGARANVDVVPQLHSWISIPAAFGTMLTTDPKQALVHRLRVRAELQQAFEQGYRIVDFDRRSHRYLLIPD